jgi:hypothetical protein
MCVTVARGKLSNTIVLAAQTRVEGEMRHVMGYQNRPSTRRGPNAMVLPVPTLPGTLTPDALILTEDFPHILDDMVMSMRPSVASRGEVPVDAVQEVVVFKHGIYTVVLAQHAGAIPAAYPLVPERKRPPLNRKLFDAYDEWYPDWPVLVCCFDNQDAAKADPILLTYQPRNPDVLFFPALDCHTGKVPNRRAKVLVDHDLVFSTPDMPQGMPVHYRDDIPDDVRTILPDEVLGIGYRRVDMPNGDWVVPVAALNDGRWRETAFWWQEARLTPPHMGM